MRFFTIILVLLTTSFFANQSDSLKLKNWAIGATFSPDYCYRMPYKVKPNLVSTNTESAVLGITTGFNVLCRLSNIIAIETGILYSTKGQRITNASWLAPNYDYYDPSIPNSGSPTVIPEPARQNVFTYKYIEIPLKVNVYLVNKKFKLFPSIGCSTNIFVGKKTVTQYKTIETISTNISYDSDSKNIPSFEFGILAGIGMTYDINKNVFVKFEPSYRTFIRPLIDGPIRGTFYSIGVNTGFYYRF